MDRRRIDKSQLARERAVYDYLESLEKGDIDGIIASLEQALYDAPLDQMLVEAHQEYFQEEKVKHDSPDGNAMPIDLSSKRAQSSWLRATQQKRRNSPRWMSLLTAALLCVVLVSSFVALLAWRQGMNTGSGPIITPTSPAITPTAPAITPTAPPMTPTITVPPSTSACSSFKSYSQPAHDQASTLLSAVSIVSANSAWAVGYSSDQDDTGSSEKTLTEYWDGKSWQIVPSPNGPTGNGNLNAVAAVSAKDVWAVGSYIKEGSARKALIEHWDGSTWKVVANPNTSAIGDTLDAIAVVSAKDVWAVGSMTNMPIDGNIRTPLIEHWDGSQWNLVSGFPEQHYMRLSGLAVISAQDIWVAGVALNTQPPQGILAHWNGSSWKLLTDFSGVTSFTQVSAIAPNDVWALGTLSPDNNNRAVVEHWNGSTWSVVPLPAQAPEKINLFALTAVSTQNVWAVGTLRGSDQEPKLLILHWNGQSWKRTEITVPNLMEHNNGNALAIGYGQTWIVGVTQGYMALIEGCA